MANNFVSPTARATGYVVPFTVWNADIKTNEDELADHHGVLTRCTVAQDIGAADVAVLMDAEDYDTDAFHSVASNQQRLTVPAGMAGYYQVNAHLQFASDLSPCSPGYLKIKKNVGATVVALDAALGNSSGGVGLDVSINLHLDAGDYLEIFAASVLNNNLLNNTAGANFFGMHLLNRDG